MSSRSRTATSPLRDLALHVGKGSTTVADECLRFRYEESPDLLARMASRGEMDYAEVLATVHDIIEGRRTVAEARAMLVPDVLSSLARLMAGLMTPVQDFRDAADISQAVRMIRGSIRLSRDAPRIDGQANLTARPVRLRRPHPRRRARRRHAMDPSGRARAPGERPPGSIRGGLARGVQPAVRRPRAPARHASRWARGGLRPAGRRRSRPLGRRRSRRPGRHRRHVDVQARPQLPDGRGLTGGADVAQPRDHRGRRLLAAGVRRPARVGRRHRPPDHAPPHAGERWYLQDPQPRDRRVPR